MDQIRLNTLAMKIQTQLEELCTEAEDLTMVIPLWIDSRKKNIQDMRSTPESLQGFSSCMNMGRSGLSKLVSAVPDGTRNCLGTAASAAGTILTMGTYQGFKQGVYEFNNRRLNTVAYNMKKDRPETAAIIKEVENFMKWLSLLVKDLEEFMNVLKNDTSGLLVQLTQQLNSIAVLSTTGSSSGYQLFQEWSERMKNLLEKFLDILRSSMEPDHQLSSLYERNHGSSTHIPSRDIHCMVEALDKGLKAVHAANSVAHRNALAANNVVSKILHTSGTVPLLQRAMSSFGYSTDEEDHASYESAKISRDIDQWLEQVRELYQTSIDVANDVREAINKSGLAHGLQRKSKPEQVKKDDASKIEYGFEALESYDNVPVDQLRRRPLH